MENCGDTTTPTLDLDDLEPVRLTDTLLSRFERLLFDCLFQRSFQTLRHKLRKYLQSAPRTSTLDVTKIIISPPVRLRIESALLSRCASGILGIFLSVTQIWLKSHIIYTRRA